MRKICIVTGSRAEYGLLRWIMQGIKDDANLELQIIATGSHLNPKFGSTYHEIELDGFYIDRKLDIYLESDEAKHIAKSMGHGLTSFAGIFDELKPDLIVVLGDRYEIFSAVSAALISRIPVAHIHGGELTEGAFDDALRHAITKMSHIHFVAASSYRQRVIQMGEQPQYVFEVGGLGLDGIAKQKLMPKDELEDSLGFKFGQKNLLITFHPVTLSTLSSELQINHLLDALSTLVDTKLIFTLPNADPGHDSLITRIQNFASNHSNAYVFSSLGQLRYFSCIQFVDGVIGNSSSGILEVPTFKKGTINIGDRQLGRLQATSIINCMPSKQSILNAIYTLYTPKFQESLKNACSPYGDIGASEKILEVLRNIPLTGLVKKSFFDQPFKNN